MNILNTLNDIIDECKKVISSGGEVDISRIDTLISELDEGRNDSAFFEGELNHVRKNVVEYHGNASNNVIAAHRERRKQRMDDEEESNSGKKGGHGNTRLPYGLAKGEGIDTTGMQPKEVWAALEGKGYSATVAYKGLKDGKRGTELKKETAEKSKSLSSAKLNPADFKTGDYGKKPIPPSRYDVIVTNFEHFWNNPPTKEQAISLNQYGQHTYGVINHELREGKTPEQSEAPDTIKNLDDYISACKLPFGITVFRGAGSELVDGYKTADEINEKMKGAIVQDKAYVSTSLRQDRALVSSMQYEIKVPQGKGIGAYVADHTGHENEYEFLLARGTYFKINGARTENGKTIVEMEVAFKDAEAAPEKGADTELSVQYRRTVAQEKTLKQIIKKTANLKKEQYRVIDDAGDVVLEKKGDKGSVAATVGEKREFLNKAITIHNHPIGGTFSAADLTDFGFGAKEIVAATPEGTYTLTNAKFGTKEQFDGWVKLKEACEQIPKQSYMDIQRRAKENLSSSAEAKKINELAQKWVEMKDSGVSQADLDAIYEQYDSISKVYAEKLAKERRRVEVEPFERFYRENAEKYGFIYSSPFTSKRHDSATEKFRERRRERLLLRNCNTV